MQSRRQATTRPASAQMDDSGESGAEQTWRDRTRNFEDQKRWQDVRDRIWHTPELEIFYCPHVNIIIIKIVLIKTRI